MAFALFPVTVTLKMINYKWLTFPLQVRFTLRNSVLEKSRLRK